MEEVTALEIVEDIKVKFPTVYPVAVITDKKMRNGNPVFVVGVYENDIRGQGVPKCITFSMKFDYDYFLEMLHVFHDSIPMFFESQEKGSR